MRVAIASCAFVPEEFQDDPLLAAALRRREASVERIAWDDPAVDWHGFDLVVVRSTWDYAERRDEFVTWADSVGERLRNRPDVLRWNSDKRYLADLAAAGFDVVPTRWVEPGAAAPELEGEVVVKPAVSAGGRDTGRFGPQGRREARALLARLGEAGRVAMVQPYLGGVDERGESALAFIGGAPSHALRKGAVLRPDEEAPVRDDALGAAEVMYDPDLVGPGEASDAERRLAADVVAHVAERFGESPLYARVDMVPGPDGRPVLLELEAIEPNLYLAITPGAADRLAAAIVGAV